MQILKQETFEHDGRKFLLKVFKSPDGYAATAYDDQERQVTAVHEVKVEHTIDVSFFNRFGEIYALQILDDVKDDIAKRLYVKHN